ncbi:MAG: radical SAM protein [Acidobacteriaceae bacterium]
MNRVSITYPTRAADRDQWILAQRPPRHVVDPETPYAFLVEDERTSTGEIVPVATIFLTNRECPWRCIMCDLWRNTLAEPTPPGAIPAQIEYALEQLRAVEPNRVPHSDGTALFHAVRVGSSRHIKLYNAGSFFDPRAIPPEDHLAIAESVRSFDRVIVECHPALINDAVLRFRDLLSGQLEIAMGLETAHPEVLEKLNKRLTLDQFKAAADFLHRNSIDLRVFILVQPPFMRPEESLHWAERSLDFAFDCGATAATLIPTRAGNGAMDSLARAGEFTPPTLATLEAAVAYGLKLQRGHIFSDLWDLPRSIDCPACSAARVARLRAMNLSQTLEPPIPCEICGGQS